MCACVWCVCTCVPSCVCVCMCVCVCLYVCKIINVITCLFFLFIQLLKSLINTSRQQLSYQLLLSIKWNLSSADGPLFSLMPVITKLILIPLSCAKKIQARAPDSPRKRISCLQSCIGICKVFDSPGWSICQCGRCVDTCMAAWLVTHATGRCILLQTHQTHLAANYFIKGMHPAASQTGIL